MLVPHAADADVKAIGLNTGEKMQKNESSFALEVPTQTESVSIHSSTLLSGSYARIAGKEGVLCSCG